MIYEKLAAVQQELKAPKDKKNTFGGYNYRSAEGILEAVKPLLAEHGLTLMLSDEIVEVGGRIYVKATAWALDPEDKMDVKVTAFAREPESKKGMDEAQVTGAASSYARKYALNALLLIDDTKDADTDEYTKQTKVQTMSEIRQLAKDAGVPINHILTQAGVSDLEEIDFATFEKIKKALTAKLNG